MELWGESHMPKWPELKRSCFVSFFCFVLPRPIHFQSGNLLCRMTSGMWAWDSGHRLWFVKWFDMFIAWITLDFVLKVSTCERLSEKVIFLRSSRRVTLFSLRIFVFLICRPGVITVAFA
jgi:hypothetical protein